MPDSERGSVSRRQLLEMTSAGSVAALAGCTNLTGGGGETTPEGSQGNGGEENDGGGGTTQMQVVDAFFDTANTTTVNNIQFNPYNPSNYGGNGAQAIFERLSAYNLAEKEFRNSLLADWSVESKSMTLTLEEGWKWHDGEAVTADDLIRKFKLDRMVDDPMWEVTDHVEKAGDHTVKLVLSKATNPKIIQFDVLQKRIQTPKSTYQKFVDDYESASSDDARDDAKSKLLKFTVQEPVGNGPFEYAGRNEQRIRYTRVDDHPYADQVNFGGIDIGYRSGNQQLWQAFISDQSDGQTTTYAPPNVVDKIPGHWLEVLIPGNWGLALAFDHEDEVFGKRAVRQAVAHVLSRKAIQQISGPRSKQPVDVPAGMVNAAVDEYLGDAKSDFEPYAADDEAKDVAEAESLMQSAGYSRNGDGTWVKSNGNPIEMPVKAPAGWSDWITGIQTAVSQLQSFGFKASMASTQSSTWYSEVAVGGNYRVSASWWTPGGAKSQYPYYPLHDGLNNTSQKNTFHYAPDGKVTVPSRTGSGETTVNVHERLTELAQTTDDKKATDIIRQLAWVYNVDLPKLPLQTKYDQSWTNQAGNGDGNGWEAPPEDSSKWQVHWPQFWLPRQGELRAKTS